MGLHRVLAERSHCTGSPPIASFPYQYFLNLVERPGRRRDDTIRVTDGRVTASSCIDSPERHLPASATVHQRRQRLVFGDLGNDWMVGGTGKDDIYGGWGNDL